MNNTATHRNALLIVNRNSRNGGAYLEAGFEYLRSRGLHLIEERPNQPDAIAATIHRYRGEVGRVILGGGDGTLNCAAPALVETGLPLGILPLGTANDLARTLEIPDDPIEACRVIAENQRHAIDVGRVNGCYYFNSANIGLGVKVTHRLSEERKSRWGILGYARSVIEVLDEHRPFRAEITCDGQTHSVRSIQIAVGNGRYYGGGMTISKGAEVDDHLLHIYSIAPQSFWSLLRLAPALRSGHYEGLDSVHLMHGRRVELRTHVSMDVSTDGELATQTPAEFEVVPNAVSVYVPGAYLRQLEDSHVAA